MRHSLVAAETASHVPWQPQYLPRAFTRVIAFVPHENVGAAAEELFTRPRSHTGRRRTELDPRGRRSQPTAPPRRRGASLAHVGFVSSWLGKCSKPLLSSVSFIQRGKCPKSNITENRRASLQTPAPGFKARCCHFLPV